MTRLTSAVKVGHGCEGNSTEIRKKMQQLHKTFWAVGMSAWIVAQTHSGVGRITLYGLYIRVNHLNYCLNNSSAFNESVEGDFSLPFAEEGDVTTFSPDQGGGC
jgi:hypothetical protein